MKKARSTFVTLFLALVGAAVLGLFLGREPETNGKPLRYWLARVDTWDRAEKEAARSALRAMGKTAVPFLIRIMQDDESQTAEGIEYLTNEWRYAARFFPPEPRLQNAAVTALGEIGPAGAKAIPALEKVTRSDNHLLAYRAEAALLKIRGEPITPLLHGLCDTCDITNWTRLVGIAAELGDESAPAVPLLTKSLHDTNLQVRVLAVDALNRIHDERAIEPLIECLGDEESSVRKLSLHTLASFHLAASRARPAVMQLLSDRDSYMRSAAMVTLCGITSPADSEFIRETLAPLQNDPSEYIRRDVTQRLQRASSPASSSRTNLSVRNP